MAPPKLTETIIKRDNFDRIAVLLTLLTAAAALVGSIASCSGTQVAQKSFQDALQNEQPIIDVNARVGCRKDISACLEIRNIGATPAVSVMGACYYRKPGEHDMMYDLSAPGGARLTAIHRIGKDSLFKVAPLSMCDHRIPWEKGVINLQDGDEVLVAECYRSLSGQSFFDHWTFLVTKSPILAITDFSGNDTVAQSFAQWWYGNICAGGMRLDSSPSPAATNS